MKITFKRKNHYESDTSVEKNEQTISTGLSAREIENGQ